MVYSRLLGTDIFSVIIEVSVCESTLLGARVAHLSVYYKFDFCSTFFLESAFAPSVDLFHPFLFFLSVH